MKRIILFCMLLTVSAVSQAVTTPSRFIMTAAHCDTWHEQLIEMVAQKRKGVSSTDFKKYLAKQYEQSNNKVVFGQINPYILATVDEYYSNTSLAEIDYASVIGQTCRDVIGQGAE